MRLLCISIFLLVYSNLLAQDSTVSTITSEIFNEEKFKTSLLFAEEDSDGDIYIVRDFLSSYVAPKGYYIEHYDKNLKLLKKASIEINASELRGLFLFEDEVRLIEFRYIAKEKRYSFVALQLKKSDFSISETELLSIDRTEIKKYDHYGIRKEPDFGALRVFNFGDVTISENKKFFVIQLYKKEKKGLSFYVKTFRANFEELYTHSVFEGRSNKGNSRSKEVILTQQVILDNNGDVYLLGKLYPDDGMVEIKRGKPNYSYQLVQLSKDRVKFASLPIQDKFVNSLAMLIDGEFAYCFGLYSDDFGNILKMQQQVGTIRFKIDKAGMSISDSKYSLFKKQFQLDKYGKYNEKGAKLVTLRTFDFTDDGGIIFNTEEYFRTIKHRGGISNTHNSYSDIMSFKIDTYGEVVWSRNINKRQITKHRSDISKFSFASFIIGNGTKILFNTDPDIDQMSDGRRKFKTNWLSSRQRFITASISDNGGLSYESNQYKISVEAKAEVHFSLKLNKTDCLMEIEHPEGPQLMKFSFIGN